MATRALKAERDYSLSRVMARMANLRTSNLYFDKGKAELSDEKIVVTLLDGTRYDFPRQ